MSKVYTGLAHLIAVQFHEVYENLAPNYGYKTRKDTRIFDETTANGKLMIATIQKLLDDGIIGIPYPGDKIEEK